MKRFMFVFISRDRELKAKINGYRLRKRRLSERNIKTSQATEFIKA